MTIDKGFGSEGYTVRRGAGGEYGSDEDDVEGHGTKQPRASDDEDE